MTVTKPDDAKLSLAERQWKLANEMVAWLGTADDEDRRLVADLRAIAGELREIAQTLRGYRDSYHDHRYYISDRKAKELADALDATLRGER